MSYGRKKRIRRSFFFVLLGVMIFPSSIMNAERLPIKTYTTVDGLPHNSINRIAKDSRGFLWFCTGEGLSRFDGYSFVTYGVAEGLPHPTVNDLLQTRLGDYWIATNGGLCKFNPKGRPTSQPVYAVDSFSAARWRDDSVVPKRRRHDGYNKGSSQPPFTFGQREVVIPFRTSSGVSCL